jgi:hypothetical protein
MDILPIPLISTSEEGSPTGRLPAETLIAILANLDPTTLLCSAQRVNHRWQAIVSDTPELQRLLWFQRPPPSAPHGSQAPFNPFIERIMTLIEQTVRSERTLIGYNPNYFTWYPRHHYVENGLTRDILASVHGPSLSIRALALLHPDASWRRMLVHDNAPGRRAQAYFAVGPDTDKDTMTHAQFTRYDDSFALDAANMRANDLLRLARFARAGEMMLFVGSDADEQPWVASRACTGPVGDTDLWESRSSSSEFFSAVVAWSSHRHGQEDIEYGFWGLEVVDLDPEPYELGFDSYI